MVLSCLVSVFVVQLDVFHAVGKWMVIVSPIVGWTVVIVAVVVAASLVRIVWMVELCLRRWSVLFHRVAAVRSPLACWCQVLSLCGG